MLGAPATLCLALTAQAEVFAGCPVVLKVHCPLDGVKVKVPEVALAEKVTVPVGAPF